MKTNQLLEMCLHLKSKAIENQELKAICRNLSETKINMKRTSDNISNLQRVIQIFFFGRGGGGGGGGGGGCSGSTKKCNHDCNQAFIKCSWGPA